MIDPIQWPLAVQDFFHANKSLESTSAWLFRMIILQGSAGQDQMRSQNTIGKCSVMMFWTKLSLASSRVAVYLVPLLIYLLVIQPKKGSSIVTRQKRGKAKD
jgi:hypothetical protein